MNKQAMKRLVSCYRKANSLADEVHKLFGKSEQLDSIAGDLLDAVWIMLGEHTNTITESVTYRIMTSNMEDETVAEILIAYMDGNVKQPAPVFFTDEQVKKMNVGYSSGLERINVVNPNDNGRNKGK